MEIIGIVASPHAEGMTMKLMQRALAGARAEGATVKLMHLATEELNPCRGCGGRCFDTQTCVRTRWPRRATPRCRARMA